MSDIYRTQTNHTRQQAAPSLPTAESRRVCRELKVCSVHYEYSVPAHAGGFVLMPRLAGGGGCSESFINRPGELNAAYKHTGAILTTGVSMVVRYKPSSESG